MGVSTLRPFDPSTGPSTGSGTAQGPQAQGPQVLRQAQQPLRDRGGVSTGSGTAEEGAGGTWTGIIKEVPCKEGDT